MLERRPYDLFSKWQFILGAIIGAGIFASIENIIYIKIYLHALPQYELNAIALLRWTTCTSLHLLCSLIVAMGLIHIWDKMKEDGKPADISNGFAYFAIAIAIHGIYNLSAVILNITNFF